MNSFGAARRHQNIGKSVRHRVIIARGLSRAGGSPSLAWFIDEQREPTILGISQVGRSWCPYCSSRGDGLVQLESGAQTAMMGWGSSRKQLCIFIKFYWLKAGEDNQTIKVYCLMPPGTSVTSIRTPRRKRRAGKTCWWSSIVPICCGFLPCLTHPLLGKLSMQFICQTPLLWGILDVERVTVEAVEEMEVKAADARASSQSSLLKTGVAIAGRKSSFYQAKKRSKGIRFVKAFAGVQ